MKRTRFAALAVTVFVLAGCGASVPRGTAATAPPSHPTSAAAPSPSGAPGAAFCAKLRAQPKTVQVVYASEVERQVSLASGGGSVTPEAVEAARSLVASWITISCPRFAYLEKQG